MKRQITRQSLSNRLRKSALAIIVVTGLAACGGGSSSGAASGQGNGVLQVRLTDAHTDEVTAVNVAIVSLKAKPAGQPPIQIPVLFKSVDLLTLQNTSELLADATLAAQHYEYIMVELDASQSSIVENGQLKPLQIPNSAIKVLGGFDVLVNGETTILLDFDAESSLNRLGNQQWLLNPVILMKDVTTTGGS